MFYSKSTGGFYSYAIHGDNMPRDSVEISEEDHAALMLAQANGKKISGDSNGQPVAIDAPKPKRTQSSLLNEVADKRWKIETGGIIVSDVPIKTDRESQAQLSSVYISLKSGLIESTPWKAADGSFSMVAMEDIEPIAKAVAVHVSACFTAEKTHIESISELHYQGALDRYDTDAGWPAGTSHMEI